MFADIYEPDELTKETSLGVEKLQKNRSRYTFTLSIIWFKASRNRDP
jgi:hypothetical protein